MTWISGTRWFTNSPQMILKMSSVPLFQLLPDPFAQQECWVALRSEVVWPSQRRFFHSPAIAQRCGVATLQNRFVVLSEETDVVPLARFVRFGRVRPEKREEPPSNRHDVRAPLALKLKWTTLFSCSFFAGKHINLLEPESLVSLLRRLTREGIRAKRLFVLVDSCVVLGAVSKGRASSRNSHFLLRKLGFWCLASDIAPEVE